MAGLRRLLKFIIAVFFYYSGLLALCAFFKNRYGESTNPKILMYHRILDDNRKDQAEIQPGMCTTRSVFDGQMKFIAGHYRPIPFSKLIDLKRKDETIPARTVAITFDDGWQDNYRNGLPILKKHNMPAIIFLATDLLEAKGLPVFLEVSLLLAEGDLWPGMAVTIFKEVVAEFGLVGKVKSLDDRRLESISSSAVRFMETLMLLDYRYIGMIAERMKEAAGIKEATWAGQRWMLNWDEIKEMMQNDIEFGSHGISHDLLINIPLDQVKRELAESKRILENRLGKPVQYFSYPNGDHNADIRKLAKEAGYLAATAIFKDTLPGERGDLFALRRIGISEGSALGPAGSFSKAVFACLIEGLF